MRTRARTDANQKAIVAALRRAGVFVESLHRVGGGVPDLLLACRGKFYLAEIKMPGEKLNTAQREWHAKCRAPILTFRSMNDAALWLNGLVLGPEEAMGRIGMWPDAPSMKR